MQYPLEPLHLLMRNTWHPLALTLVAPQPGAAQQLSMQIVSTVGETKMAICRYLAAARNPQQAVFMLHALRVAINDLSHTLEEYRQQLHAVETSEGSAVTNELYALAGDQFNYLQSFLCEHFDDIPCMGLPAYIESKKAPASSGEPLITSLSVPQLALLIRLMVDAGMLVQGQNISALMSKIATHIQTRKVLHISAESLRVKYYSPEKAAISILRDYMQKMIQLLRNY